MIDVLTVLGGRRAEDAPRPDPGDVVTTLRCPCGTVVGLLARSGGESWLWRASYRHTPRGAAEIVLDAALEDFEALARIAKDDPELDDPELSAEVHAIAALCRAHDVDSLAALLPPLTVPARTLKVTGMAETLAALDAERASRHPAPEGYSLAPSVPAFTDAGCRKCRRVQHLGAVVAELEREPAPPRVVVVTEAPPLGGIEGMGYDWPAESRAARVALYRALNDVLESS